MTLPEQSDRAVKQTREFLVRLASPYNEDGIKGIRREVRAEALALLRHYPFSWNSDCPGLDNAANADNTPDANATPSQCSVRNGCTLTDAEREAISRDLSWLQWCEDNNQIGDVGRRDIKTLRGLLERMA